MQVWMNQSSKTICKKLARQEQKPLAFMYIILPANQL